MPLTLPCPACNLPLAPHSAMCSRCGARLARGAHGDLHIAPPTAAVAPPPNRRACSRCGILNDLKAERCVNCRRHLHHPHRVAGMAILFAIVLLGMVIAVNNWLRLLGGGAERDAVSSTHAAKKTERQIVAPPPTAIPPPTNDRGAREEFAARLRREHKESRVKIALGGEDLTVITFTGAGFSGNEVDEFTASDEMMGALRTLGFRRVIFSTGRGSTWSHSLGEQ